MKLITTLPPGDWKIVFFRGDVIFVCPEHGPRILDVISGTVFDIDPNAVSRLMEIAEAPAVAANATSVIIPGPETKQ